MALKRNLEDKSSCLVEELGVSEDGTTDKAVATITGSYPDKENEYNVNKESDMKINPISGTGAVVLRTSKMRISMRIDPQQEESVLVPKGTGYYYTADSGQTLVFEMECTPPWSIEQYDQAEYDDVN